MSEHKHNEIPASLGMRRGPGGGRGGLITEKPKNFKQTLLRTVKYFSKEYFKLVFVFLCMLISVLTTLYTPFYIGRAIDSINNNGLSELRWTILILFVLYGANAFATLAQGFTMAGISQRAVMNLRHDLFAKMQNLPLLFFDTKTHGDLMSRFSNDIDNISGTISQAILQIMSTLIIVIGAFIMMWSLSPILTLASLLTIPLVFALTRIVAKRTRPLFKEQQNALGKLNGQVEESISGVKMIKAFNKEDDDIDKFSTVNEHLCQTATKAQILSGFIMPMMEVINNLGITIIALTGGILAIQGSITIGVIASFLSYSRQFTRPLNEIGNMFNTLQSAVAGAERVFEVFDQPSETPDAPNAIDIKKPKGDVEFSEVYFGYNPETPVLSDISFSVEAGHNIALVGPTGAGKTTLINLLTRFYDINSGLIKIDGKDIFSYRRNSLRSSFGIVLQDTYLFSGTIRENILYGKPDASDEELSEAASIANADTFINQLPQGYDTMLSESGSNLSQGQRQLIAIARAVLSNPPFLILDEATSNIDTRTEIKIQEGMMKLMYGKTSFIIAHRLSTIRNCDLIMVIDGGRIIEKGTHEELLEQNGVYTKMYQSQFS